ncbi:uncharacterized protein [Pyrus communis]|uniref:uncharacterized protein n=1 Tax=Pyrus communis TaxID=23211 RepID=UPI0035C1C5AB
MEDRSPLNREIKDEAVGFFQSLIGNEFASSTSEVNLATCNPVTSPISSDMAAAMVKEVFGEEIRKIMANRIKGVLPTIISDTQSAFVVGCRIGDNILFVQELFRGYNLNNGTRRCAIKVDIRKAYDTLDWKFLLGVLLAFNFHPRFVQWIRCCISSAYFSVAVNGELVASRFIGLLTFSCPKRLRKTLSSFLADFFAPASHGGGNVWSKWVKAYFLQDKCFWSLKVLSTCSWNWRKLLKLQDLIKPLIHILMGDGSSTFMWYDLLAHGSLLDVWGYEETSYYSSSVDHQYDSMLIVYFES